MEQKHPENQKLAAEIRDAVAWRLQIRDDDEPLLLPEARRFIRWAKRSPSHLHEYLCSCRLDEQLARKLGKDCTQSPETSVPSWRASLLPPRAQDQRYRSGWSTAAAVLVLAPTIVYFVLAGVGGEGLVSGTTSASIDSDTLGDGAEMFPDSDAKWVLKVTDQRREVHLHEGSVLFDVYRVSGRGAKPGAPVIKVRPGKPYQVPSVAFAAALDANSGVAVAALAATYSPVRDPNVQSEVTCALSTKPSMASKGAGFGVSSPAARGRITAGSRFFGSLGSGRVVSP